jgi:hypothetical protein
MCLLAQMGFGRPSGWAGAGEDVGRAFGLGPVGKDRFFLNLFLMRKQFQKNLEIVLEARKLLRKFPKFQENS